MTSGSNDNGFDKPILFYYLFCPWVELSEKRLTIIDFSPKLIRKWQFRFKFNSICLMQNVTPFYKIVETKEFWFRSRTTGTKSGTNRIRVIVVNGPRRANRLNVVVENASVGWCRLVETPTTTRVYQNYCDFSTIYHLQVGTFHWFTYFDAVRLTLG